MLLRRASLVVALFAVLAMNLHFMRAVPIPRTLQPCLTSSCPKQKLHFQDSPSSSRSSSSSASLTRDNSTCTKGYADCPTDTGFLDCCDEAKVILPQLNQYFLFITLLPPFISHFYAELEMLQLWWLQVLWWWLVWCLVLQVKSHFERGANGWHMFLCTSPTADIKTSVQLRPIRSALLLCNIISTTKVSHSISVIAAYVFFYAATWSTDFKPPRSGDPPLLRWEAWNAFARTKYTWFASHDGKLLACRWPKKAIV